MATGPPGKLPYLTFSIRIIDYCPRIISYPARDLQFLVAAMAEVGASERPGISIGSHDREQPVR
jgi:hypothetical protein